jgi:GTP pyrophosphokinase
MKKGQGLVVHTHDCPSIAKSRLDPDKWIEVDWDPDTNRMFDVVLKVVVLDQRGVLAKVAAAIADAGCNIANVSVDTDRGLYATNHFTVQVANRQHLAKVLRSLRRTQEVVRIARVKD